MLKAKECGSGTHAQFLSLLDVRSRDVAYSVPKECPRNGAHPGGIVIVTVLSPNRKGRTDMSGGGCPDGMG